MHSSHAITFYKLSFLNILTIENAANKLNIKN